MNVLLTGPTGGLGRAVVAELAARPVARLILLGRASTALDEAAAAARAGGAAVDVVAVDLADLGSIRAAVAAIDTTALTSVILNAGLQTTGRGQVSRDGIELTFAVNVVAQHALLRGLQPTLADDAHVVLVGSGTHFGDWHSFGLVPAPRWDHPATLAVPDPRGSGPCAYATSKLGLLYLAHEWQRRYPRQLRFTVFDPALMAGTGLAREVDGPQQWAWRHVLPRLAFLPGMATPAGSARDLTSLALGERWPQLRGGYVEQDRVRRSSSESYDPARERELWDWLDEQIA